MVTADWNGVAARLVIFESLVKAKSKSKNKNKNKKKNKNKNKRKHQELSTKQ